WAGLVHDRQSRRRADKPAASGGESAEDHVAALFPAEIQISRNHLLDYVTIAHFSANDFSLIARKRFIQTKVAHDRRYQRVVSKLTGFQEIERGNSKNFVAVHDLAVFVAKQNAISVAIVCYADVGVG